jgi:hypothetical protein
MNQPIDKVSVALPDWPHRHSAAKIRFSVVFLSVSARSASDLAHCTILMAGLMTAAG